MPAPAVETMTDGGETPTGSSDPRHASSRRLLGRALLAALLLGVLAGAVVMLLRLTSRPDDAGSPDGAASASVTPTTATPTTATPTTATPTTAAPMTVGPLIGGPGPIPVIRRIPTFDPVVFITIDDGVHPDEDALTVIRDQSVPVTLFLNQTYLKANGDYFRRLQDLGAVIGSHTMSHADLKGTDAASQHSQICDLDGEFAGRFGQAPTLFRPPYGSYDRVTLEQAASCGITTAVHWSAVADSGSIVTADGPLRPGDIILLHFKPGLGLRLRAVIAQAQAAGLHPANLSDYIASAPPPPPFPATAPTTTASTSAAPLPAPG